MTTLAASIIAAVLVSVRTAIQINHILIWGPVRIIVLLPVVTTPLVGASFTVVVMQAAKSLIMRPLSLGAPVRHPVSTAVIVVNTTVRMTKSFLYFAKTLFFAF